MGIYKMIGITGASGEVSSKLSEFLTNLKEQHCLLLRDPNKAKRFLNQYSHTQFFDWNQPNFNVLKNIAVLFWLLPNEHSYLIDAERQWLAYAKQAGVKHIVKLSSLLAESNDIFFHRESEKLIEDSGIPFTHLRANTFMQNFNEHDLNDIKNHVIRYPMDNGKMSFIDTRDIAEIAAKILLNPTDHINKAYTLTGPESLDLYEVAHLFSHELGIQVIYKSIPKDQNHTEFYQAVSAGDFARIDPSAAIILGRRPYTLAKYIHDYRDWFI